MTKKLFLLLLLFCSYTIFAQDFISDWDTSQIGTSGPNEITIPTNPAFTYDYTVDWGDGPPETNITGNITHTYATPGIHTISISGDFPSIYFNGGGDRRKIIEILAWGTIQWQTMENAFLGCENLNFDAIDSPDLSQVTSLKNMFKGCTSFNGIINDWNVSNVTDISGIFFGASIFNRPLNNWFNISSVTDMSDAFNGAELFNEPLDSWQVGLVNTMERMFRSAAAFNQNINNWDVSQVTNMAELFSGASNYSAPLNIWTVDNVEDMSDMLANTSFNSQVDTWNVGNVTNMAGMFRGSPFNQPLNPPNWDVSKVTNMSNMFFDATNFNQPLNGWTVDSVTDMSSMFSGATNFNQPLNDWIVDSVTDMSNMFARSSFNLPLHLWNVSNVTNMMGMFSATNFNQPLNWNVSKVTNMSVMFEGATDFNQDINTWVVSEVTNMFGMFKGASAFNQPLNWNVSKVTNMEEMFNNATQFDQPLNSWNVSNVTNMIAMFNNAPAFNQDLSSWNVSSVTDMTGMFFDAIAFDQSFGSWNVSNVTDMTGMLANSALSLANYDTTLIGWALLTLTADVELGALDLTYCDGRDARQELIDNFNWTIFGDTVDCPFVFCTNIISPIDGDTNVPDNFSLRWEEVPGATGYRVSVRSEAGVITNIVMDNDDVGDVVFVDFASDFTPGDVVYATVVPYDAMGPAIGCTEETYTITPNWVNSPDAFKFTVDTNLDSSALSDVNQLRIETNTDFTYNYSIDWGDGEFNHNVIDEIIHTYVTPGIYTVSIIGDYPHHFYNNISGDNDKLITVNQWGTQVWQSMESTFYDCGNIIYNAIDTPDLSQVTSMSGMCESSVFNGDINNWDVSNVTDMSRTFIGASAYNQPLNSWNVSNVTDMSSMFLAASAFDQPIGDWNVGNVTTMLRMFYGFNINTIFNQPLNDWDVSKVTNMESMFRNNIDFDRPLNDWEIFNVITMQGMFQNATAFNGDINDWDVSSVTNMSSMFRGATSYNQTNNWNVSAVTTMAFMFQDAQSFDQTLNNWDVSAVITMESMFENALAFNELINWNTNVSQVTNMRAMFKGAETFNQPLNDWDVNSVVTMQSMFENALAFNQPLPDWNVSAVATMASMFQNAMVFDQPINTWNVSSVTLMNSMFEDAQVFNKPINDWGMNVSSVTRMDAMFKNALAFDQPLNNWDTGEALTMAEMFSGASVFNQPIDSWNVSFVSTMESMFQNAITYNQTMDSWNVTSVNTMRQMFSGATAFNELIDSWNVRSVQTMEEMFDGALLFNQTINSWRVSGVSNMNRMFRNASAYNQSLDRWDIGTISMQSMFENASTLDQSLADWNVSNVTNMSDMLDNTVLSLINYDNTLIAWSEQTLSAGITLGAQGLTYCEASEERQSMIDTFGWAILDDISGCLIPECTQLVSPLNLDTDVPVNTNLNWEPVIYAKGYRLTVLVQPGNITLVNNVTVNETSYEFAADFPGGETVSVTLTPFNDTGDAVSCTEESFVITSTTIPTAPECTKLTSPVDGATNVAVTTDLSWAPVNNADGYRITAGTSSGVNNVINQDVGNVTSYDIPTDLAENTTIYVTITPYNEVGDALGVCNEESFTTQIIPVAPACTNLISPANNDTDVPVDTDISWTPVAGATGYIVVVGNTPGGIQIANNDVKNVTTYDLPDNLSGNRTFYVTIIPYNEVGDAIGCNEESFRTETVATVPDCTNLNSPSDDDIDVATNLASIAWDAVTDATGYRITVSGTANNNVTNFEVTTGTSYNFTNPFLNDEVVSVTIVPFNGTINPTGCTPESFTIIAATTAIPDCTNLNSPSDDDIDVATNLASIAWDPVTDATGYRITVSGTANNNVTNFEVTTGTFYNFTNPFLNDEVVSVTIVPFNGTINATGCTPESFTIVAAISTPTPPLCTNLSAPIANAIDVPVDVANITWDAVDDAIGYRLSVTGSISNANNLSGFDIITGTSYDFTNDFIEGETVTVIIVPFDTMSDASGCTSQSFTIVSNTPTIPNCTRLISPANGSIGVNITTDISWEEISNADGYRLSIGTSSGATNILENEDVSILTNYSFQNNLAEDTTYYINIVPYNAQGDATDCTEQSFTTAINDDGDGGDGSDIDNTLYGFSPNGDGNNDFWQINGIEANPENIVYIYNRWGDLIFQIEGYDNQSNVFRGIANKKTSMGASNLPNGTYFFNIQVSETHTLKKLRGFIVIKR